MELAEIKQDMEVEWLYETRRGWGYRYWIPGVVVKVGKTKVTIKVGKVRGGMKNVSVLPSRLRPKSVP